MEVLEVGHQVAEYQALACIKCAAKVPGMMLVCTSSGSPYEDCPTYVRHGHAALCPDHYDCLGTSSAYKERVSPLPDGGFLRRMMQTLWSQRHFGDLEIVCADHTTRVHGAVLAAASPALAAMVQGGLKESTEHRIVFPEKEWCDVQVVLQFIYTGVITANVHADADMLSVFELAHMYGIVELAELCGRALVLRVNKENVACILRKLRGLKESQGVAQLFEAVKDKARRSPALINAVLDGV